MQAVSFDSLVRMDRPKNILLVDDDEADRALFLIVSEALGFNIRLLTASNGWEAIQYLEGSGPYRDRCKFPFPDLVISDLKMPVASGFELLAWRKRSGPFTSLPVVVLSGSNDQNDISKAMELGANRYFLKPCDLDGLKETLRTILQAV